MRRNELNEIKEKWLERLEKKKKRLENKENDCGEQLKKLQNALLKFKEKSNEQIA